MPFLMTAAADSGGEYSQPTPGAVSAVLVQLVDLGTQSSQFGDKQTLQLLFEIDERRDDGKRHRVSMMVTRSMHPKAKLRQFLESWRGKAYREGEEVNFGNMVGAPAMLTLKLSDNGYTNIDGVARLPKAMTAIAPESPLVMFDLTDPDWDAYEQISERIRIRIEQSPEFAQTSKPKSNEWLAVEATRQAKPGETADLAEFDDDVPF